MRGVINNLGHRTVFMRGERIYESPGFFQKLMLVERGVVAKALLDPFHKDPLLISLSGPAVTKRYFYRTECSAGIGA